MKNIVITPAVGIELDSAEFFIKTLRQYYQDDVFVLISNSDYKLKEIFAAYN